MNFTLQFSLSTTMRKSIFLAMALLISLDAVAEVDNIRDKTTSQSLAAVKILSQSTETACINLSAPREVDSCELTEFGPPASLTAKGWYWSKELEGLVAKRPRPFLIDKNAKVYEHKLKLDDYAHRYLIRYSTMNIKNGMKFWGARQIGYPTFLDPPPGQSEIWKNDRPVFRKDELNSAMTEVVRWARAWKKLRGNKYKYTKEN